MRENLSRIKIHNERRSDEMNFMKRKVKNFLFALFALTILVSGGFVVKAVTTWSMKSTEISPTIYYEKKRSDGHRTWNGFDKLMRSDGQVVYCIEPWVNFITGESVYKEYDLEDYADKVELYTKKQLDHIRLITYYGYGYGNHTEDYWIAVTQMAIWRYIDPDSTFRFTTILADTGHRDAPTDTQYDKYFTELNNLVNNHGKKPSLTYKGKALKDGDTIEVNLGESIELEDSNGVLSEYTVTTTDDTKLGASKRSNTLVLDPKKVSNGTHVNITRTYNKNTKSNGTATFYYVGNTQVDSTHYKGQDVATISDPSPTSIRINVKVNGITIKGTKQDTETGKTPQGDATLEGAVFGVYDEEETEVCTATTDAQGNWECPDEYPLGTYKIREKQAPTGYIQKTEDTTFTADSVKEYNFDIKDDVIKGKINVYKTYGQESSGELTGEENAKFDIFLKSTESKVGSLTTDNEGHAESDWLPYGTYKICQTDGNVNYWDSPCIDAVLHENNKTVTKLITNEEVTMKLRVLKVDKETQEPVKLPGIKFEIYDEEDNQVCQVTDKKICVYETDENGVVVTPLELKAGTYKLKETDQQIYPYVWNQKEVEFTINNETDYTEDELYGIVLDIKFENEQVKGHLTINKTGQQLVIEDGKFHYETINLEGVKFEVKAKEDIVINGHQYYQAGDHVGYLTTNSDGVAELNDLRVGKYTLQEVETDENHQLDDTIYEFSIDYKDQYTAVINVSKDLTNKWKTGKLVFTKTDLVTGDTIPNTTIEIYKVDENNENEQLVYTGKTDYKGQIVIEDLFVGKFYLIEKEANSGYQITDEKVFFEIDESGNVTKATLSNKPNEVTIIKRDSETGETLEGVKFGIYTIDGTLVYEVTTNEEGVATVYAIPRGEYYIQEIEALEGYELDETKTYFTISDERPTFEIVMNNERITLSIENTGEESDLIFSGILVVVAIGVITVAIIQKKNKNK